MNLYRLVRLTAEIYAVSYKPLHCNLQILALSLPREHPTLEKSPSPQPLSHLLERDFEKLAPLLTRGGRRGPWDEGKSIRQSAMLPLPRNLPSWYLSGQNGEAENALACRGCWERIAFGDVHHQSRNNAKN
jgi:hypothetical protein